MLQETHLVKDDVNKLENDHYRVFAFSCALSKTKGVITFAHNTLPISIIGEGRDEEGRVAFVKCKCYGRKLVFVNIYALNNYDNSFFEQLNRVLAELSEYEQIIGSDMNTVLDPKLDKSSKTRSNFPAIKSLKHLLLDFDLVDFWRVHNPSTQEFTFYSNRHKSFSRIDYVFISESLTSLAQKIEMKHMSLTDHHAYKCKLVFSSSPRRATRWRFNLTLLQNENFCEQFELEILEFLKINRQSVNDAQFLWDAVKGFIRNNAISFASKLNKEQLQRISDLERTLSIQNIINK